MIHETEWETPIETIEDRCPECGADSNADGCEPDCPEIERWDAEERASQASEGETT